MNMDRMRELVDLLNRASEAYYQRDEELMSNLEYDRLYDELIELEKTEGRVLPGSPTQKVGYEIVSALAKVRHTSPMLSLNKTKDMGELKSFLGEQEGILSWKLDGLTIVLTYREGRLVQAVTRGSGQTGEDVTHNARYFINLPPVIPYPGELILRGEAVISYSDFEGINANLTGEEQYKNPRNLCSGSVRQLNSEIAAKRQVRLYPFSLVKAEGVEFHDKKSNTLAWLTEQGFTCVEHKLVEPDTLEEAVLDFQRRIVARGEKEPDSREEGAPEAIDLASDGLVLTYNSISYSLSLGATSKFPRDSIAFKWADEIRETRLVEVRWNTSRTGLINPIAIFEPVELEGTQVNKAGLHNVSIFEGMELGEGDRITVYKANMIIPQVADNLTRSGSLQVPGQCPVCHEPAQVVEQNDVKCLYCVNPNCRAQLVRSLAHFTGRDAMNIEALSEATLEKFVEAGYLNDYMDIYGLEKQEEKIKCMEGFGEKSVGNLLAAIERSRDVELPNFLYALGIPQVGLSNAKLLSGYFDDDLEKIKRADVEELSGIKGFGESISMSVSGYFSNEKNLSLLNRAEEMLRFVKHSVAGETSSRFAGLTFVITGDLVHFSNRKELRDLIEKSGGRVAAAVSAKTSYLINNNKGSASSKNKKAAELNIPVIDEEEFMETFM